MLSVIKSFFETNMQISSGQDEEHACKLATTVLMIEMMRMDDQILVSEEHAMIVLIKNQFTLSDKETDELIGLAHLQLQDSTDYYQFTSLINKQFAYSEKIRVIELLWTLAYADKVLNKDEGYLVRKISELIYVSHTYYIAAKHKARPNT